MTGLLLFISLFAQANPFVCGQTVKISATPKTGYRFVEWSDGITEAEREVELYSDSTLTARFEKEEATSIETQETDNRRSGPDVRKILIDNHLFIIRDDKTYTIQGARLK